MSMLQKVRTGQIHSEWLPSLQRTTVNAITWMYCPGHAGVRGNEQADSLASTGDIREGLTLGKTEVLRELRQTLKARMPPAHHSVERLQERGIERGSGRRSTLRGRERAVVNQTDIGTISVSTLGRLLREGEERIWAFPSAMNPP